MFEFTQKKPPSIDIWNTILSENRFDSETNPTMLRTIVWYVLTTTTNFPAAKAEINKYLEGKVTKASIENGFIQSVETRYGFIPNTLGIDEVLYVDEMAYGHDEELRTPIFILKSMLDSSSNKEGALAFMKATGIQMDTMFGEELITDIWSDEPKPTLYAVQMRFNNFISDKNFRRYFIPTVKQDTSELPTIFIKTEDDLVDTLKGMLLGTLRQDKPLHHVSMEYNFQIGKDDEAQ